MNEAAAFYESESWGSERNSLLKSMQCVERILERPKIGRRLAETFEGYWSRDFRTRWCMRTHGETAVVVAVGSPEATTGILGAKIPLMTALPPCLQSVDQMLPAVRRCVDCRWGGPV